SWVTPVTPEDDAAVRAACPQRGGGERPVVDDVLGDDGAPFGLRRGEDGSVGLTSEVGPFGDGVHIVTACPQVLGGGRRPHLVEQEPHRLSTSCSRRQAASAASASASTRASQWSTSSRKSA